jgi:nucleoside-diphosphate-sugar epimerase
MKNIPIQRILVTGGAGFIGFHSVNLLLQQNKEVIVLDNFSSDNASPLRLTHPQLELVKGDILNYTLVKKLVSRCDAVLHLAAVVSVQQTIEHPIHSFQVNTLGHLHILEAIRELNRPIRLVYSSSAAVYGQANTLPCRDDQPLLDPPISPYALQKINNEEYAQLYKTLYGVNSVGLRYFNVYGPGQNPNSPYSGVISRFLEAYQQQSELIIFGDGHQSRDFIYVTDVAQANWLALQSDASGVMNIATGQPHTLLNLIKYIEEAGEKIAAVKYEHAKVGDIYHSYAANKLALDCLNFQPSISLQQGIRLLV